MAKNELLVTLATNEQVNDIVDLIKLLAKLTDTQKAKIEGIAIGMSLERPAKHTA